MKLPEDKKERTKILVLIAIGAVGAIYMVVQLSITPLLKSRLAKITKIQELKEDFEKARKTVNQASKDRKTNQETILRIKETAEKYVLPPRLGGNYQLGASEIIEKHARDLGIGLTSLREFSISDVKQNPAKGTESTFKTYTLSISLECGFHELVRLLRAIESSNPYLCITSLEILGQPKKDPGKHNVHFNVQWPIWSHRSISLEIEEQLKQPNLGRKGADGN